MANEEHVARLRAGVWGWNQWRGEHGGVRLDLRGADLEGADLEGANLSQADLEGADLSQTILYEARLSQADLSGAKLIQANLIQANLSGAKLIQANLSQADLSRARLSEANLRDANLYGAGLSRADLYGADLSQADLSQADLSQADLSDAKLIQADLSQADLSDAKLIQADLQEAIFGYTIVGAVDLRDVHGLEAVVHRGPSTIGLDTVERSQGQIPESFLRGCGVSDRLIEYIPSLTMQPIQYYSCFISYSSHDEALAERLHADLQAKGVRCWFAPEDLKIGDSLIDMIGQAIRLHEKLLIMLSESSVGSRWVAREVKAALARELREGRQVLFPIRLDDAVQQSDQGWAAELWDQRKIGDFCGWQDYPTYQAAFARLLRDLKAPPATP